MLGCALLSGASRLCVRSGTQSTGQMIASMQVQTRSAMVRPICHSSTGFGSGVRRHFVSKGPQSWPRFQNPFKGPGVSKPQQPSHRQLSSGSGGGSGRIGASGPGGGGGGGSGGGGLWTTYLRLLEQQPIFTKAWSAALLNALGDVLSQVFIEGHSFSKLDWKRLGIFTFLGLVLVGPALHWWYGTIGRVVTASGNTGVLMRLALDQLIWAPAFIAVFISALMTLEGHSNQIKGKLKQDLKTTVVANWKLWVPFQFLNFRFIPANLQVLAANVVAVAWNTYLSNASHAAVASQPEDIV